MAGIRFFPADATEQRQLLQRLLCWAGDDRAVVSVGFKPSFGPHGMVEIPSTLCTEHGDITLKPGGTAIPCNAAATTWSYVGVNSGDTAEINIATCTEPTPPG